MYTIFRIDSILYNKINTSHHEAWHSGSWLYFIQNVVDLKQRKPHQILFLRMQRESFLCLKTQCSATALRVFCLCFGSEVGGIFHFLLLLFS